MGKLTKPRFVFAYPLAAWLLFAGHTTERQLHVGIGIVLLGVLVRFWANGYVGHVKVNQTEPEKGQQRIGKLVTAGPYAYVRHPLYLGSCLIGAGFCLITGNLWFSVVAIGIFLIVYRRKMAHEESLLHAEVGTPYGTYQDTVPRWLPTWRRYPNRQGHWSWQGIAASREWKTLIWVVVIILALYFREEIFQEHEWFRPGERLKHTLLLITGFALMLTDGMLELRYRRKRQAKHVHAVG